MDSFVFSCKECCFNNHYHDDNGTCECHHPQGDFQDLTYIKDEEVPDFCPLKKEEITIKIQTIKNMKTVQELYDSYKESNLPAEVVIDGQKFCFYKVEADEKDKSAPKLVLGRKG